MGCRAHLRLLYLPTRFEFCNQARYSSATVCKEIFGVKYGKGDGMRPHL